MREGDAMNRAKFFAGLRARGSGIFGTKLSQRQIANLEVILDEAQSRGVPLRHLAYILATPYHEVGSALVPVRENLNYTTAEQIRKTWKTRFRSTAAAAPYVRNPRKLANLVYGGRMGNTGPDDGWVYRGGGYPQTTGKDNYRTSGALVGVDLVANPERILEPRIAAVTMIISMTRGLYTGKKLADYLSDGKADYVNARAIINADVKANGEKIAGYAKAFEKALREAGYVSQELKSRPLPIEDVQSAKAVPPPAPAQPQRYTDKATVERAQTRLKELGYAEVGGIDGKLGDMTRTAILAFRNENGLPLVDAIDDEMLLAMLTAKPRKLAPERTEAPPAVVHEKVPEAKMSWWSKIISAVIGAPAAIIGVVGGSLEYVGAAKGYIDPIKEGAADIPGYVWIAGVVGVSVVLFLISRRGEAKSVEAFQSGERR